MQSKWSKQNKCVGGHFAWIGGFKQCLQDLVPLSPSVNNSSAISGSIHNALTMGEKYPSASPDTQPSSQQVFRGQPQLDRLLLKRGDLTSSPSLATRPLTRADPQSDPPGEVLSLLRKGENI